MATAGFWAQALYAPLADTRASWEATHPQPARFLGALELVPTLVDGTELERAAKSTREPQCIHVPEHAWLAQRLVLAYVCHIPYVQAGAPPELQPFRAAVARLHAFLQRREATGYAARWLSLYADAAIHDAQSMLYHLLHPSDALKNVDALVPVSVCRLPACPHQVLAPARLETDRAVFLLQHAARRALGIPEQRFLLDALQRYAANAPDACICFDRVWDCDVASVAAHNTHVAYEWLMCIAVHTSPTQEHWEVLGEAFAAYAKDSLAAQRRIHDLLARLSTSSSTPCLFQYVQAYTLPRYFGLRAQDVELAPEDAAEALGTFAAQLIEKNLLPIHASQRHWNTILSEDALDALAVELRSLALAYSKYAFGAHLFHALTHPTVARA